jgi:3-hydroxyacyl-[acyl-carrier-protein] dehydratase
MWQTRALLIPGDHPSAGGHFPGNPIIPGALLLDAVVEAVAEGPTAITISNAKFLRPVIHGTALQLRWQAAGMQYRFECRTNDDVLVMSGTLAAATSP